MVRIVVLCGGESQERDVSLDSGFAVAKTLAELEHEVQVIDLAMPEPVLAGPTRDASRLSRTGADLRCAGLDEDGRRKVMSDALSSGLALSLLRRADLVFLALHGGWGGDGRLQALLEVAGVAFTGAASAACSLAWDKYRALALLRDAGVPATDCALFQAGTEPVPRAALELLDQGPVVVKANKGTSHHELSLADDADGLTRACLSASAGEALIATPFLAGQEYTIGVVGGHALPVVEIEYAGRLFDFRTKSDPGAARCRCPADIPDTLASRLREYALRAHQAVGLGAEDHSRIDFRCDSRGEPHCLEVNACPGLRPLSGLGVAAAGAGHSYTALISQIVALGHNRRR